jgi:hypothetical protein
MRSAVRVSLGAGQHADRETVYAALRENAEGRNA